MKQCAMCGKGSTMAGTRRLLRGHYNPTNWSRKFPNLQKKTLPSGERAMICTQCMRTLVKPPRQRKKTEGAKTGTK
ncbi:MAG: hypothetical protein COU08_01570 [Candidatus Harrisonbacteria bacterium CG10_big_fil_rev_8_21_14_0_10_42_17]|uniref:50S ribosomal protein L28 n=1 Tax=Candidatus Harrisonbacteria bacterium CG10_big_fil_rev_8_21_14_0_10_42_17 TaxID=1974584 RepID=A0A2M6WIR1_9BACT|nr:MAG: hypothetical protein COU08_01570 [Candidatus Harrisonbacteria bacterium CG10_big_fil_rev_8_21_14_0_10_42_17]